MVTTVKSSPGDEVLAGVMALGKPEVWVAAVLEAVKMAEVSDSTIMSVGNQFLVEVVRVPPTLSVLD